MVAECLSAVVGNREPGLFDDSSWKYELRLYRGFQGNHVTVRYRGRFTVKLIDMNASVDIVFYLKWKSEGASHTEGYHASRVNMWRDLLPSSMRCELMGKEVGDQVTVTLDASRLLEQGVPAEPMRISRRQFAPRERLTGEVVPGEGRFYPKGVLHGVPGIFPGNIAPFRLTEPGNGYMEVDLNHPLAGRELILSAVVGKVEEKGEERGGTSTDWPAAVAGGPGMQARWRGRPTDYLSGTPFTREDESDDRLFYKKARFAQHLDRTALEVVEGIYDRHLSDGMAVLDLMAGPYSHIPEKWRLKEVVGLGMNRDELDRNRRLTDVKVHDLNREPALPLISGWFDAVICSVSVEYLTDPLAVFREVERVLRPGGIFIVTFSNRWFPPKAIGIWKELHEFERMGLVSEYFFRSGGFRKIRTWSMRGLPRPRGDKYYHAFPHSDPVYAVWGEKR